MSSYAQIYVIANNHELFENHLTSMQAIKGEESTVLGMCLSHVVNVLSHMVLLPVEPSISIVGGSISAQKLRLIGYLARKQRVVILGEVGLLFAVAKYKKNIFLIRRDIEGSLYSFA